MSTRAPERSTVTELPAGRSRARRILAWAGSFVAGAGLVGGAVWLVWFSPYLVATEATVTGASTVSVESVAAAADDDLGRPLIEADLEAITDRVLGDRRIASAAVSRDWPHGISIAIVERVPVAVVRRAGGWGVLDAEAVEFLDLPARPERLVEVDASGDGLATALRIAVDLPDDLRPRVTVIRASTRDDATLGLLHKQREVTVIWGSAERDRDKAEVLRALLSVDADTYNVSAPDRPATYASPSPSTSASP